MRRVIDYNSDKLICNVEDTPPMAFGNIIRIGGVNYTVIGVSEKRLENKIYVVKRTGIANQSVTPDYELEAK